MNDYPVNQGLSYPWQVNSNSVTLYRKESDVDQNITLRENIFLYNQQSPWKKM